MNVPKARAAAVTALRPPTRPAPGPAMAGICAHEPAANIREVAIGAGLSLAAEPRRLVRLGPALSR